MKGVDAGSEVVDETQRMPPVCYKIEATRSLGETQGVVVQVCEGLPAVQFYGRVPL